MLGVEDGASSPATTTEQRPLAARPFKLKAGTPSVAGGPFFDGREPLSARESKVMKAQSGAPYQVTHAAQPETCTTPADTARRARISTFTPDSSAHRRAAMQIPTCTGIGRCIVHSCCPFGAAEPPRFQGDPAPDRVAVPAPAER